jgi:uncharacterized protein YbaR (Trm112 family)
LHEDGFALIDSKGMETNNERIVCRACGEIFPLSECLIID